MEILKHPAYTVGWVARLSQLAFSGKSNPNFPWEKFQWNKTVVEKNERKMKVNEPKKQTLERQTSFEQEKHTKLFTTFFSSCAMGAGLFCHG